MNKKNNVDVILLDFMKRACFFHEKQVENYDNLISLLSKDGFDINKSNDIVDTLIYIASYQKSLGMPLDKDSVIWKYLVTLEEKLPIYLNENQSFDLILDDFFVQRIKGIDSTLLDVFYKNKIYPKSLKINDWILEKYTLNVDLSNYVLIATQHLFASIIPQFDSLHQLGIRYERMFITGKAYSANALVVNELEKKGAYVNNMSINYYHTDNDKQKEYQHQLKFDIQETINNALACMSNESKKLNILILDDGGITIDSINNLIKYENPIDYNIDRVFSVEQTRRGTKKLEHIKLLSPTVNVAESNSKLILESPLIGESVLNEVMKKIKMYKDFQNITQLKVLIIGYGSIGLAVTNYCKILGMKSIFIYDVHKSEKSYAKNVEVVKSLECLQDMDLVFGCSGNISIPVDSLKYITSNTMFVSTSTSNTEFLNLYGFSESIKNSIGQLSLKIAKELRQVHLDQILNIDGKEIIVLNGGFPINFDGSLDPIRAEKIQLTRGLMLLGSLQAIKETKTQGLISLDKEIDEAIGNKFESFN